MDIQSHHLRNDPITAPATEFFARFLVENLEEYGDSLEDVTACFDYARERGGLLLVARDGDDVLGVAVTNETGMSGYIPANILVYLAVAPAARRRGVGMALMTEVNRLEGGVALHVEKDNPARVLYERSGFEAKYIEMRRSA